MTQDTSDLGRLAQMRSDVASGEARRVREHLGLTQAEVAREAGVQQPTLSQWEAGVRRPTGAAAVRYAAVLADLRQLAARVTT